MAWHSVGFGQKNLGSHVSTPYFSKLCLEIYYGIEKIGGFNLFPFPGRPCRLRIRMKHIRGLTIFDLERADRE